MEMRTVYLATVLLVAMVSSTACASSPDSVCNDTMGKEFHLGVLESFDQSGMEMALVVSGNSVGHVMIEAPSIGLHTSFTLTNNTHTIPINAAIVQKQNNTVEDKAIKVTSTVDVSVALVTYEYFTNEQMLVLPTACLSTRYFVSTYYPERKWPDYKSNFLVIATEDNTTLDITLRVDNSVNSGFTIPMESMQSYLFNNVEDLTGTIIKSDKPIAVFSGHELIILNHGSYVSEQLIPSTLYGSNYIVPPLYPKSRYFIRILSSESDTRITYSNSLGTINATNHFNTSGEFLEVNASEPLHVTANEPVSVMLYSYDYEDQGDNLGDPFLSVVPATTQYMSKYIFTVPDAFKQFISYISIIALRDSLNDIRLDGQSLPNVASSYTITVDGRHYMVNTYIVEPGFHRLESVNQVHFGAMIYGYIRDRGYGSYLGLQFTSKYSAQGTWSAWSEQPCSVTCGLGTAFRIRKCNHSKQNYCEGDPLESVTCNAGPCPAGTWSDWFVGKCSVTSGQGTAIRIRQCSTGHIEDCPGSEADSVTCPSEHCSDTMGKEFHLGVLESFDQNGMEMALVVSGNSEGHVMIEAPSIGLHTSFTLSNNTNTIPINASIVQKQNNTVENKAIKVTSTVDVSVALVTYEYFTNEQVLVLPIACLSTRYIVSTYYPERKWPNFKSQFLVIATEDNTIVDIDIRVNNSVIGNLIIHMNSMQSYMYNNVEDLTGTIIASDKPIAVFSGHEFLMFTHGAYVSEQLIPSTLYGLSYIVPPLYPKSRYFIRILSSESDTRITYINAVGTINTTTHFNTSGEFLEVNASEPLHVTANKPVSVMLYSYDYEDQGDNLGDPFLSVVPATTQYMSKYIFTVPDAFKQFISYISIIALRDSLNVIRLDGQILPNVSSSYTITVDGRHYMVNTYIVGSGFHRLENVNQDHFGAMIYGYIRDRGYGSYLGLQFTSTSSARAGTWSDWFVGKCSVTSGQGTAIRIRQCSTGHIEDCPGNAIDSIACNPKPCSATGTTTQSPVHHCLSSPCQHGGECEDLPGTFNCFCSGGYFGRMCDEDYDECVYRRPCKHGGTCHNTVGSYTCICPAGFVGRNCEGCVDDPSTPCQPKCADPSFTRQCPKTCDKCAVGGSAVVG